MAKIDYELLLDNALKNVVREALIHAQINGLGDGMHFYKLNQREYYSEKLNLNFALEEEELKKNIRKIIAMDIIIG